VAVLGDASVTIVRCTITGNTASGLGGGVSFGGGSEGLARILDATIVGNTAAFGGGVHAGKRGAGAGPVEIIGSRSPATPRPRSAAACTAAA